MTRVQRLIERGITTLGDVEEVAAAAAYDAGERAISEGQYRRIFALAERLYDSGSLEPEALAELERACVGEH